jgi:uncharacterized protein YacL
VAVEPGAGRGSKAAAELLRLGIVLLMTAGGFALGDHLDGLVDELDPEAARLVTSVLGALVGYVVGGEVGRAMVRSVDAAGESLAQIPAVQLIAAAIGASMGAIVGVALLLPVLVLPLQQYTVPIAIVVLLALVYLGGRIGGSRGAELGRFIGVRGRLEVRTPSRGLGVKVVDSSALIDGRLVEVARSGFLEGTLVVPQFVLREVQGVADSSQDHRRRLGRRGLAAVKALQDEGLVAVEITDEDPDAPDVDAKLAVLARERRGALITGDANLASVAELNGVRTMNLHALADAVRSPVLPGDRLELKVVRPGQEPGQGVAYSKDGTMVVIEGAAERIGETVEVDVTSIVQSRKGRLLFGAPAEAGT